ncbi:uncharacterized protein LOC106875185 [Octopus bimaculoides]|uniref:ISXO2-like transposase domain-containing protein n=1 Tax=Octopus bimaculoides TaxID=37653 RepID=A0A0L8GR78_OCTBM|nr:uncharacterized protein LOC106875185 [Octopus bimaculoides]|eukprot:XP_014778708.1 PREDICTED: uncharacterized protein LOC106875185 [Octopus bimaculoides]
MDSPRFEMMKLLSKDYFVQYLQENKLISQDKRCSCRNEMSVLPFQRATDGVTWRCRKCKKTVSIRKNTFLERSQLPVFKIFSIILDFICEMPVSSSMSMNNVSKCTAIQWYQYCREICSKILIRNRKKLGGPNHVVEVKKCLMFKDNNQVEHVEQSFWVVGFYDNTQKIGYMQHIPDTKAETVEAVIMENVVQGSIIFTDEWASYRELQRLGYIHNTVDHSRNFVDPESGATTNHVEAYCSRIKSKLKYKSGSSGNMRWLHVEEAVYREFYHMKCDKSWENYKTFINHIAEIYPQ